MKYIFLVLILILFKNSYSQMDINSYAKDIKPDFNIDSVSYINNNLNKLLSTSYNVNIIDSIYNNTFIFYTYNKRWSHEQLIIEKFNFFKGERIELLSNNEFKAKKTKLSEKRIQELFYVLRDFDRNIIFNKKQVNDGSYGVLIILKENKLYYVNFYDGIIPYYLTKLYN